MIDSAWRPGVDFAAGLSAYYDRRAAHHSSVAEAAYREWQANSALAEKYRRLAEDDSLAEKRAA